MVVVRAFGGSVDAAAAATSYNAMSHPPANDAASDRPDAGRGLDDAQAAYDAGGLKGVEAIRAALPTLPLGPGVYRFVNARGDVLYVGKARSLRKRVQSYTHLPRLSIRIGRMVSEAVTVEIVTTETEAEALLLESDLIKRFRPRYNILLRDDKSFPYILVTGDHDYPRIVKYRGARTKSGDYFGPFASVWAVNETLQTLQRAFLLRSCSDAVFASRTRPCLLYQIKRCCAPCVDRVSKPEYDELVAEARAFLTGGSQRIQQRFADQMQAASDAMEFETAAQYRDRIRALTRVQTQHDGVLQDVGEADVVAAHQAGGQTCVQVFFFRGGRNYGNRAYFPAHAKDDDTPEVLEAFLGQFYARTPPPKTIFLSHAIPNTRLVEEALCVRAGHRVRLAVPQRGGKRKAVENALTNAREALGRRLAESASQRRLLEGLADALDLENVPERIEVYDNSHISGSKAVGGMIVATPEGFAKQHYRKFNIKATADDGLSPGDDYAMMREVLTRRFARAQKEDPDRSRGQWPDLVMIDGGQGQLGVAREVFAELGIEDVALVAVAKGPDRDAGRERIFLPDRESFRLGMRDPVLYFIQRLRDEAHRFAIGAHRQRRSQAVSQSLLDEVPGIGAKRKKALLHHFGGARAVADATREDLEAVDGISTATAKTIYDWFHPED